MFSLLSAVSRSVIAGFRARRNLVLENLALRRANTASGRESLVVGRFYGPVPNAGACWPDAHPHPRRGLATHGLTP